jgi:hypothetical protein
LYGTPFNFKHFNDSCFDFDGFKIDKAVQLLELQLSFFVFCQLSEITLDWFNGDQIQGFVNSDRS